MRSYPGNNAIKQGFKDNPQLYETIIAMQKEIQQGGTGTTVASSAVQAFSFSVPGLLAIESATTSPILVTKTISAISFTCLVQSAPTGHALTAVIKRNGTTYLTLTIAAGATLGNTQTGGVLAPGDVLTLDITAVGTTFPGAFLKVQSA